MEFKYGIISTAEIIKRFIPAVQLSGGRVLAIASRNLEKAKEMCQEMSVLKAYGSYEELYQDPEINIVYIATINKDHVSEIKKALSYGKHVICEKPLALTKKDAEDVFALAKEKELFLMEAQKSLFLPITEKVKSYLDANTLGALHQVVLSASFPSPDTPWMHDKTQGGVVYGSASYTLEYLDYLLSPSKIKVQALGTQEPNGTIDAVSINLNMDDVIINSRISMKGPATSEAVFYFERGSIKVPYYWKARTCEIYAEGKVEEVRHDETYEMRYEIEHIHECLKKGFLQSTAMDESRTIRCSELIEEIVRQVDDNI